MHLLFDLTIELLRISSRDFFLFSLSHNNITQGFFKFYFNFDYDTKEIWKQTFDMNLSDEVWYVRVHMSEFWWGS